LGFEGYISSDVVLKKTKIKKTPHQEYSLSVNYVFLKNTKLRAQGEVLIKSPYILDELMPGDNLQVRGFITKTSAMRKRGGFNYGRYLKRRGFAYFVWADKKDGIRLFDKPYNTIRRQSYFLRSYFEEKISKHIKDKQVFSLIRALIFAKKGGLSQDLSTDFKKSGVYHVLALSGLHMGLIFAFSFFFFSFIRLERKTSLVLTAVFLIVFTVFTGVIYSLLRALVMALCVIAVRLFERKKDYLNSLFLAGFFIAALSPDSIYSVSFQLSFCATLGILLFFEKLNGFFIKLKLGRFVSSSLAITLSAQSLVLPVLLYYFKNFYFISVLSNLVVVPLVGIILFIIIISLVFMPFSFMFTAFLSASEVFIKMLFYSVKFFSNFDFLSLQLDAGIFFMLAYPVFLFSLILFFKSYKKI
jgi:competence protein ComEC